MDKIVDIGIDLLENPNKKKKNKKFFNIVNDENDFKNSIPDEFICFLSKSIMIEPVIIFDGNAFEKQEIINWYKNNNTHPVTQNEISEDEKKIIIPNVNLKKLIKRNYLCYDTNHLNEKILNLLKEKLYNNTPILSCEKDEILDNMLVNLLKYLKLKDNLGND